MAQTLTRTFRVIFTISDILHELRLASSVLKFLVGGTTKIVQLPCNKPVPLDFPNVQIGSKIEFDLEDSEGNIYGYSEFPIPEAAFKNKETQINQQIHFYLNSSDKEFVAAKIFIIFLNTEAIQSSKQKNTPSKLNSKPSPVPKKNPNQSFSTPKKSSDTKTLKRQKTEEKFMHAVDNFFNQYAQEFESIIKDHCDPQDQGQQAKTQAAVSSKTSMESLNVLSPIYKVSSDLQQSNGHPGSLTNEKTSITESKINENDTQARPQDERKLAEELNNSINTVHNEGLNKIYEQEDNSLTVANNEMAKVATNKTFESQNDLSPERLRKRFQDKSENFKSSSSSKKRRLPSSSPTAEKTNNPSLQMAYGDITYYKAQIDQLKSVILVKEAEITVVEALKKENEELKLEIQQLKVAQKNVSEVSSEATQGLKEANQRLQDQIITLLSEKEEIRSKNNGLQNRIEELESMVAAKIGHLTQLEGQNFELSLYAKELKYECIRIEHNFKRNIKQQLEKTNFALENTEQKRIEERKSFMDALARCRKSMEDINSVVERVTKEKREIAQELQKAQQELGKERSANQELRDEILMLQKKLEVADSYQLVITSLEAEKQDLNKTLFEGRKTQNEYYKFNLLSCQYERLQNLLESNKLDCSSMLEEFKKREEEYLNQISGLREEIKGDREKKGDLTGEIDELKLKVSGLLTQEHSLGKLALANDDMKAELETVNKKLAQAIEEKEKLSEQIFTLGQAQEAASMKLLQVERTANELRECLNEKDEHIENLKKVIFEAREAQVSYIPHKDDPIDNALAKYINSNDIGKLKFLFIREHKGIYQFGSRRVYIKIEGDKIIIRVGGGYLTIEEFLDQCLHFELEKMTKNGPLQALARGIVMNKVLSGRSEPNLDGRRKSQGFQFRDVSPTAQRAHINTQTNV